MNLKKTMNKNIRPKPKVIEDYIDDDFSTEEKEILMLLSKHDKNYSHLARQVQIKMCLAADIDDAMKEKGWSIKDMAKQFKKQEKTIKYWLSGTYNLSIDDIVMIEDILNLKILNK